MALTDVKSEQIQSSVALAGSPTTTTQSASDNSTKIATTAYVETAVANLVASAPSALNTLDELAAALNDDASFSTTVTNSIAAKLPLAGGTLTGDLTTSGNFLINAASGNPYLSIKTAGVGNNPYTEYRAGNNTVFDTAAIFSGSTDRFRIGYGSSGSISTDLFSITQDGNVGIGTTGPSTKLAVADSGGGNVASFTDTSSADLLINLSSGVSLISPSTGTLALGTSNTERMRLDSSGSVGIGTTSPSSFNSLADDLVIGATTGSTGITIVGATNGHSSIYLADGATGASQQYAGYMQYAHASDALIFGTAATERLRILSNGNVGIGESNPLGALSVGSGSLTDGSLPIQISTGADGTQSYFAVNRNGGYGALFGYSASSTYKGLIIRNVVANGTANADGISLMTNNTHIRMHITGAGNVGIGTTSPAQTLAVLKNVNYNPPGLGNSAGHFFFGKQDGSGAGSYGLLGGTQGTGHSWLQAQRIDGTAGQYNILLQPSGGNVGIGTQSPGETLDVVGSAHVGVATATVNFTDSVSNGNTKYIEIGANGSSSLGDALLVTHSSGSGVGYFGYESGNDRLIIACDNGGGNNSIEFSVNAGTGTGGSTDNLNGATAAVKIHGSGIMTQNNLPAFNAYHNGNIYTPNNNVIFAHNATRFDNGGNFNTTYHRFTAPVAGVYYFYFRTIIYGNGDNGQIEFRVNGVTPAGAHVHYSHTGNRWTVLQMSTIRDLAANDYVHVFNTNRAVTYYHGNTWNEFSGYLVG